jgi:protein-disulfide isomerase
MKDENNQQDDSMQKNDIVDDQSEIKDDKSNDQMDMPEPESSSGFKVNRGFIIIGLILFVMTLFWVQRYVHFGDSNYKSKKNISEEQQLPAHSSDQSQTVGDGVMPNNQPASVPSAVPAMPSVNPPAGPAVVSSSMNSDLSMQDKKQIESIVQKYIEANPEVIAEALQNLNSKASKAKDIKSKDYIKNNISQMISASPYLGNVNGDLVIVEFFDYKCSYCRRSNIILERVLKDYPNVKVVLKVVPVLGQNSSDAARASLAVWSMSPQNFARFHEDLINSANIDLESIKSVARKVGISADALVKAMNNPSIQALVNSNLDAAQNVGMRGVPTFIVAGELVPGSLSYEAFKDLLDKANAKKAAVTK